MARRLQYSPSWSSVKSSGSKVKLGTGYPCELPDELVESELTSSSLEEDSWPSSIRGILVGVRSDWYPSPSSIASS